MNNERGSEYTATLCYEADIVVTSVGSISTHQLRSYRKPIKNLKKIFSTQPKHPTLDFDFTSHFLSTLF